jgi:hypothetical protein
MQIYLQPFSESAAQAGHNKISQFFADNNLKVVEKLHFKVMLVVWQ